MTGQVMLLAGGQVASVAAHSYANEGPKEHEEHDTRPAHIFLRTGHSKPQHRSTPEGSRTCVALQALNLGFLSPAALPHWPGHRAINVRTDPTDTTERVLTLRWFIYVFFFLFLSLLHVCDSAVFFNLFFFARAHSPSIRLRATHKIKHEIRKKSNNKHTSNNNTKICVT